MNFELLKPVLGFVAQLGTTAVVKTAVNHVTPADAGKLSKALLWTGSAVIGGLLNTPVRTYTDNLVDEASGLVDSLKDLTQH